MRAIDGNSSLLVTASGAAFTLLGGKYFVVAHVNNGSGLTAGLQVLSADGTNYVAAHTAFAHVNGVASVDLPGGTYKWVISGSAGGSESFDLSVWRVPGD